MKKKAPPLAGLSWSLAGFFLLTALAGLLIALLLLATLTRLLALLTGLLLRLLIALLLARVLVWIVHFGNSKGKPALQPLRA